MLGTLHRALVISVTSLCLTMNFCAKVCASQVQDCEEYLVIADSTIHITLQQNVDSVGAEENIPSPTGNNSRVAQKRNTSIESPRFVPDPQKATWLGVVFPGAGQIYNRKYWKLPIVYGGFIGCLYAYNWNSQMYSDYRQAYLDIMDADPNTDSFKDFFRPGYDFEKNSDYLKNVFKKRKDRYRRWRDLSVFAFIGVYALSVIDAYVDAQLASFDIGDDIDITITPTANSQRAGLYTSDSYYGLNINLTF